MSAIVVDKQPTHSAITLDRPDKLNALSASIVEELIQAFGDAEAARTPLVTLQGRRPLLQRGLRHERRRKAKAIWCCASSASRRC